VNSTLSRWEWPPLGNLLGFPWSELYSVKNHMDSRWQCSLSLCGVQLKGEGGVFFDLRNGSKGLEESSFS
jgi:hypothetical protein